MRANLGIETNKTTDSLYPASEINHFHNTAEMQFMAALGIFGAKVVQVAIGDNEAEDSLLVTDGGAGSILIAPGGGIVVDADKGPAYFELASLISLNLTGSSPVYIYASFTEAPDGTTEDTHETGLATFSYSTSPDLPGKLPLARVTFSGSVITEILDLREFIEFGGGDIVDASTTVKGVVKLSTAPADEEEPIAVGVNDPDFLAIGDKADQSDLEAETARATTAEGVVAADLAAEILLARAEETDIANDLADHEGASAPHAGHFDVDGSKALTGDFDAGGNQLKNLAPSSADTDAVTRAEAYALVGGFKDRENVKVATTANIGTLSGLLSVDGVTLTEGDRVLVKDQTTGSQNGVYAASSGAWSRTTDADADAELEAGTRVFVAFGTENGKNSYTLITPDVVVGTTVQAWTQTAGSSGGEVATASNVGLSGVGVFESKAGVNFGFRNLVGDNILSYTYDDVNKIIQAAIAVCTQSEAEAGTINDKVATPLRVLQAITQFAVRKTLFTTKGDIPVATASGVVSRLGVGSNGQILTADSTQTAGVKWAAAPTTGTPNALPLAGGTMAGNINMANNRIGGLPTATASNDPVILAQLQAASINYRPTTEVRVATSAALPTYTAASNVLTMSSNGTLTVDGIGPLALNDRVLVCREGGSPLYRSAYNGIYFVSQVGSISTPAKLTRATDADSASELIIGLTVGVLEGDTDTNIGTWQQATRGTINVNTTLLQFVKLTQGIPGPAGGATGTAGGDLTGTFPNPTIATGLDATKIGAGSVSSTEFGYLDGVTSAIQTQLNAKAPLASPALTGTPTTPTASPATNNTQVASTAYVDAAVAAGGGGGGGSGALTKIAAITVGSGGAAEVEFASIPGTYLELRLDIICRSDAGDGEYLLMRFNGDTGSNYFARNFNNTGGTGTFFNAAEMAPHSAYDAGDYTAAGVQIVIPGYAKVMFWKTFSCMAQCGPSPEYMLQRGRWNSTDVITSIKFYCYAGANFVEGSEFVLYGLS